MSADLTNFAGPLLVAALLVANDLDGFIKGFRKLHCDLYLKGW